MATLLNLDQELLNLDEELSEGPVQDTGLIDLDQELLNLDEELSDDPITGIEPKDTDTFVGDLLDAGSAVLGGTASGLASGIETITRASRAWMLTHHGSQEFSAAMAALASVPGVGLFAGLNAVSDKIIAATDAVQEWSNLTIDENDTVAAYVKEVIDSTLNSVIAGAPGGVVGAAATGGFGTVAGFAASAGSLMALAEYDQFMEEFENEMVRQGHSPEEIQEKKNKLSTIAPALISAGAEGIFEAVGDLVQGKLITSGLKNVAKNSIRNYLKKKFVRNMVIAAPVEVAGELATSYAQIEARDAVNIPTPGFAETMGHTILVTLGQTALMGAGGTVALKGQAKLETRRAANHLIKTSPLIDKVLFGGSDRRFTDEELVDIAAATEIVRMSGHKAYDQIKENLGKFAQKEFDAEIEATAEIRQRVNEDISQVSPEEIERLAQSSTRLAVLNTLANAVDVTPFMNVLTKSKFEGETSEDEVTGFSFEEIEEDPAKVAEQAALEDEDTGPVEEIVEEEPVVELEEDAKQQAINEALEEARSVLGAEEDVVTEVEETTIEEPFVEISEVEESITTKDIKNYEDVAPPEAVEDVVPPESEGDVVIGNEGLENRLGGSNAKTGKIFVRDDIGPLELFEYMKGKSGPASAQKKKVLDRLERQGWSMERLRNMIKNDEDARKFIALHELSHIINNDNDVYWEQGKDLLTDDKIEIEARAMFDAIRWFNQYLDEDVNAIVRFVKEEQPVEEVVSEEETEPVTEVIENAPEFDSTIEPPENRPATETTVEEELSNTIEDAGRTERRQEQEAQLREADTRQRNRQDIPEGDQGILGSEGPVEGETVEGALAETTDPATETTETSDTIVETNRVESTDDTETDPAVITGNEVNDSWEQRQFENNSINSLGKLKSAIEDVGNTASFDALLRDAKNMTLSEFKNKWKDKLKHRGNKANWMKIHVFAQTLENRRSKQVAFIYDQDSKRMRAIGREILDKHPVLSDIYGAYGQRSVFDDIAESRGWDYVITVGSQKSYTDTVGPNPDLKYSKTDDYKIFQDMENDRQKKMKKRPPNVPELPQRNPVEERRQVMWDIGRYVYSVASASNQSEAWISAASVLSEQEMEGKDRAEIEKMVRDRVLNELGFGDVRGPNVLKRGQVVLKDGAVGQVSRILKRNSKAVVVPETQYAWYDDGAYGFSDKKSDAPEGVDVKNVHDGAIYVTQEWMDAYGTSLGIGTGRGYAKAFIWHQTKFGTFAGKGAFFVAAPGSKEEALLKQYQTDMLVYEDASKLNMQENKLFDIPDDKIRYHSSEHPPLSRETFTRSIVNMLPARLQAEYAEMFGEMISELNSQIKKLTFKEGAIQEFIRTTYGFELSPEDDAYLRLLQNGLEAHPAILGWEGKDNPLTKQIKNYIANRILKMPRQGFHTHFRPADSNLAEDEVVISEKALKKAGLKIGDEVLVFRHPLVRLDSVMKVKIVGTHNQGNVIQLNPARYAIFSTGDYDGDSGSLVKALDFEKEFFGREEVRELVGDIPLGGYKKAKKEYRIANNLDAEENIENSKDLNEMVLRNASGSSLIGAVTNTETFHALMSNNKMGLTLRITLDENGVEREEWGVVKIKDGLPEKPVIDAYVFVPKFNEATERLSKDEGFIRAQDPFSLFHLAATDQAKEDILFDLSRQLHPNGVEGKPIEVLMTLTFDVIDPDTGVKVDNDFGKVALMERFNFNPLKKGFEDAMGVFRGETGMTFGKLMDKINNYFLLYVNKSNGALGNTMIERLLANVYFNASPLHFADVEGSPENRAMVRAHVEAAMEIHRDAEKLAPNAAKKEARRVFKAVMDIFSDERKASKALPTEPSMNFKQRIDAARKVMNDYLDKIENEHGKGARKTMQYWLDATILKPANLEKVNYRNIGDFRHYLISPDTLQKFAKLYNKSWKAERRKLEGMSYNERTLKEVKFPVRHFSTILPKEKCP